MSEATVARYPVRSDAEIAVARLRADGIVALVAADDEGGLNPGFYRDYGVRVVVNLADLEDARDSLGIERIDLDRPLAEAMVRHAAFCAPNEACGLVLFEAGRPVFVASLTNAVSSDHRFVIDPSEHHGVVRFAERAGWAIGGVFHSHPRSHAYPSQADIGGGADAGWIHFIAGPVVGRRPELRADRIDEGRITEVSLSVTA